MRTKLSSLLVVFGAFLMVPTVAGCADECNGNVTKREVVGNDLKLTIHDKAGQPFEFCTVQKNAADLNACRVGDIYPGCAES